MRGSWWIGIALVGVMLAGCSANPETPGGPSGTTTSSESRTSTTAALPPILHLNVTLGNATVAFSSSEPASGNATQVVGTSPVNATFGLGASRLASGNTTWTLAFGPAANATGNASGERDAVNGTLLPATVEHAFSGNGSFNVTFSVKSGSAAPQRLDATVVIRSGNATVAVRPTVVLLTTQFSGSLPADGAVQAEHPFEVPEGATRVDVVYTSDHIGLFTALATLSDPGGERLSSSDACGFGSTGAETDTCLMTVEEEVGAGAWTVAITWQVGQATEDYTFDVTVLGYA